jgi:hypothetical protein
MAFWTESASEPTRKYRFQIRGGDTLESLEEVWWWAKTIDKPKFTVNNSAYQLGNHKFNYPGIVTWDPISITIVDPDNQTEILVETLKKEYRVPTEDIDGAVMDGGFRKSAGGESLASLNKIFIDQLFANGEPREQWVLHGAFVSGINFGSLSYSDDELVEITIDIAYDYATLESE